MVPKWLLGNLVAHRGLHNAEYSENTLEAFKNAADHHYNIEMDVQLTKDGKPVVYHDLRLDRLTDHDCLVKELTLNEVRKVRYLQGEAFLLWKRHWKCVKGGAASCWK